MLPIGDVAHVSKAGANTLCAPAQTPGSTQPGVSWRSDLASYLRAQAATPQEVGAKRVQLAAALLAQPESAAAWWTLLAHEVPLQSSLLPCPAMPCFTLPPSRLARPGHILPRPATCRSACARIM